jgi:hypothetical protein
MLNNISIAVLSVAIPVVLTFASVPSSLARGGGSAGHSSSGMSPTVGLAHPSLSSHAGAGPVDPGTNLTQAPVPGTSGSPPADSALHANSATMSGPPERRSDAEIDAENRRLDRTVDSICKGC